MASEIVGYGDFRYEMATDWPKMPEFWEFTLCSDVAVDSRDRIWVFSRGKHPVSTWSADGDFVGSWGEGDYNDPHGIFIDPDDNIWLTDSQIHVVEKRQQDGTLLLELGTRGRGDAYDIPKRRQRRPVQYAERRGAELRRRHLRVGRVWESPCSLLYFDRRTQVFMGPLRRRAGRIRATPQHRHR